MVSAPKKTEETKVVASATKDSSKIEKKSKENGNQKPVGLLQRTEPKPEDLEDSISSIAQRVIEEKQKSQAADAKAFLKDFKNKNSDVVEQVKIISLSENAGKKFIEQEDHEKVQVEEAFENPISQYFANQHPDVLKKAQERHYLNDQVWDWVQVIKNNQFEFKNLQKIVENWIIISQIGKSFYKHLLILLKFI